MPRVEGTLGRKLWAEIELQELSLRELARRVTTDSEVDADLESSRRLLYKHLGGDPISAPLRRAYARALGVELDFLGLTRRERLEALLSEMTGLLYLNREGEKVA